MNTSNRLKRYQDLIAKGDLDTAYSFAAVESVADPTFGRLMAVQERMLAAARAATPRRKKSVDVDALLRSCAPSN